MEKQIRVKITRISSSRVLSWPRLSLTMSFVTLRSDGIVSRRRMRSGSIPLINFTTSHTTLVRNKRKFFLKCSAKHRECIALIRQFHLYSGSNFNQESLTLELLASMVYKINRRGTLIEGAKCWRLKLIFRIQSCYCVLDLINDINKLFSLIGK